MPRVARQETVLFLPDYDRRPRSFTGSAALPVEAARGLTAACGAVHRRWGIAPRPEKSSPFLICLEAMSRGRTGGARGRPKQGGRAGKRPEPWRLRPEKGPARVGRKQAWRRLGDSALRLPRAWQFVHRQRAAKKKFCGEGPGETATCGLVFPKPAFRRLRRSQRAGAIHSRR